jgi:hypothetical protein
MVDQTSPEDYQELLDFAYGLAEQVGPHCGICADQQATALILKRSSERWTRSSDAEAKKNTIDVRAAQFSDARFSR